MTESSNLLTVKQAAEALGVSEQTIKRRIKAGEIRAIKTPLPGKDRYMLLIDRGELEQPTQVVDVVQLQKPLPVAELHKAIVEAITSENAAMRTELQEVRQQLSESRQELAAMREVLTRIEGKIDEQPAQQPLSVWQKIKREWF